MSVPTTGTPLEIAKIEREKQTKELLGFGNSPISRADLAQMQEIQNLFNAHKQAGSQLLQAGRITTEEYYENTRRAGIKLGILREDEYPTNLSPNLKIALEIGGAVIGGVVGGLAGLPGGPSGMLAGESLGSGLGSAAGTFAYAALEDFTAPDGLPTASFEDRGVVDEAIKEGALVASLTAGIGGLLKVGRSAMEGSTIGTKATERLSSFTREQRDKVLNSKTAQKLRQAKNGFIFEHQKNADEAIKFLRSQGITPNVSMVIDNLTIKSLITSLSRTPLLSGPGKEAEKLYKDEVFKRMTEGVKNNNEELILAPLTSNFIKDAGIYKLKPGVKTEQLDDMGAVVSFLMQSDQRQKNIKFAYDTGDELLKKEGLSATDFATTANLWNNFNTANLKINNFSKDGLELKDVLTKETNEMADNLFGVTRTAAVPGQLKPDAAKQILKDVEDAKQEFVQVNVGGKDIKINSNKYDEFFEEIPGATGPVGTRAVPREGKTPDLAKLEQYTEENLKILAKGKPKTTGPTTAAGKAFAKEKNFATKVATFKQQLNTEYQQALEISKYLSATDQQKAFARAVGGLRKSFSDTILDKVSPATAGALRGADDLFITNRELLTNSKDLVSRTKFYQELDGGEEVAKRLSATMTEQFNKQKEILSPKLNFGQVDKNGDILDNAFLTKRVVGKDGKERNYFEYVTAADGKTRVRKTIREQLAVPGMSAESVTQVAGTNYAKSGDVVADVFLNGTPSQLRQFKDLVGREQFRKAVDARLNHDIDRTLIKYLNSTDGSEGTAAIKAFEDAMGINDPVKKARIKSMLELADFPQPTASYEEIVDMVKMLNMGPESPALNQFIQRSMMLRFSQGVTPYAVAGLFGGTGFTQGGLLGGAVGLGSLYFFNKIMFSPIYGETVKGLIRNYRAAAAAKNKEKMDEISRRFSSIFNTVTTPIHKVVALAERANTPFTPALVKQTAINLGVSEDF